MNKKIKIFFLIVLVVSLFGIASWNVYAQLSCGPAGGNTCAQPGEPYCDGYAAIESSDCSADGQKCCYVPPAYSQGYYQGSYEYGYPSPYSYQTPSYPDPWPGLIDPGFYGCQSDSDCGANPGGVATCCLDTEGVGSRMCASSGGGPYCYSAPYSYQTPAYSYETPYSYQTPESYSYQTPPSGMSGTLTPAASSCTIASGQSTCNINFSWSVSNPESTTAITKPVNVTVATGHTGSNVAFTIPYNTQTFYLYNNSILLDQETVTSSCASGTAWNGTTCAASSCEWSAWGSWSACSSGQQSRTRTCPGGTCCTGSYIEYQSCGSTCTTPAISADPAIIRPGNSSVLSWCAPVSCTGTSSPVHAAWDGAKGTSGTYTTTPTYTTTYTITCGAASAQATVTLRNAPWFQED